MSEAEKIVFISWAGPRAKYIAAALRDWLPNVIQSCRPWMSEVDIGAGQRSLSEIAEKLKKARIGIIVLTPENLAGQWLHFEAGALSKTVDNSERVVPYLFELETNDIVGPLEQFQMKKTNAEGTREVLEAINLALDSPLNPQQLLRNYEKWSQELQDSIGKTPRLDAPTAKVARRPDEIMDEILNLSRRIASTLEPVHRIEKGGEEPRFDVQLAEWAVQGLQDRGKEAAFHVSRDPLTRLHQIVIKAPTGVDAGEWLTSWMTELRMLPSGYQILKIHSVPEGVQIIIEELRKTRLRY